LGSQIMKTFPIQLFEGHLFLELGSELWLLDTGAPTSFGMSPNLSIAGEHFSLGASYLGLTAAVLSGFLGVPCVGLLGADVLGRFDHLLNTTGGTATLSTAELSHSGQNVDLDNFMGIPIVSARVGDNDYRMFFDTGAQISYLQDDALAAFPSA